MAPSAQSRIETTFSCDVLVIGAGVAGYCAAIQAGRRGCETILLEKDPVLGGNAGPLLGVGITGADRYAAYAAETGLIHEIQEEAAWLDALGMRVFGAQRAAYTISRRFEAVVQGKLEAAGVRVLKRHHARDPIMEGRRIAAVIGEDLAAFRTFRIDVRHAVIEASGDGEIAARAGADFAMGTEARADTGERSAPDRPSPSVQGSSLVAIAANLGRPVSFTPPPGTPSFKPRLWEGSVRHALHHGHDEYCRLFRGDGETMTFLYVTETGGDRDTIRDDGAIYEDLLKSLWAEWDHIKNGPHAEDARNWDLLWISPKAGKRESRRFLGDYILTQTDLEAGRRFDDDIAYGGHNLDEHRMLPSGHAEIHGHSIPPLYGIPYRCCTSRNVDNLLLAGRLLSATHLAHSSVRVMRTGGAVGQAVGLAAAMCRKHRCTPREVGLAHILELQDALLRADASLLGRPRPAAGDLARQASVSASSELTLNQLASPGERFPLIACLGNLVYDWRETLEAVEFFLQNVSDAAQPLKLSVWRAREAAKWRPTDSWCKTDRTLLPLAGLDCLAEVETAVPAGLEGWHRVPLVPALSLAAKNPASDDDILLIALDANPFILWSATARPCSWLELWELRSGDADWHTLRASGAMRLFPEPPLGEAAQAVNGFARRFSTAPANMWMTPPEAGLPQDLMLSWPAEVTFSRIELTFDNLAREMRANPWEDGPRVMPYLVRDYVLEARTDGAWHELVCERDNFHRFREHVFPPVTARELRLRILAMHGEGEGARLYEIGIFS